MSMTVAQQNPSISWAFEQDTAGSLVSLTGTSQTTYGAYAPGVVEINSSSTVSKKGVTRANITVRVPLTELGPAAGIDPATGAAKGKAAAGYAQIALTASLPNVDGILGSTANAAGVPSDVVSSNLAAISEALQILLNLICSQETGVLASGKALIGPANTTGLFDSKNPIARGLAGIVPVESSTNRAVNQAAG